MQENATPAEYRREKSPCFGLAAGQGDFDGARGLTRRPISRKIKSRGCPRSFRRSSLSSNQTASDLILKNQKDRFPVLRVRKRSFLYIHAQHNRSKYQHQNCAEFGYAHKELPLSEGVTAAVDILLTEILYYLVEGKTSPCPALPAGTGLIWLLKSECRLLLRLFYDFCRP